MLAAVRNGTVPSAECVAGGRTEPMPIGRGGQKSTAN